MIEIVPCDNCTLDNGAVIPCEDCADALAEFAVETRMSVCCPDCGKHEDDCDCCRRCDECAGLAHHWLPARPDPGAAADKDTECLPRWECKHCDATLPYDPDTESGFPVGHPKQRQEHRA